MSVHLFHIDVALLDLMTLLIAIFGVALMGIELAFLKLIYNKKYIIIPTVHDKWIKLSHASIGLYWAIFYTYVFIQTVFYDFQLSQGTFWVRVGITLTLAIILANAIFKYRMTKISPEIKS